MDSSDGTRFKESRNKLFKILAHDQHLTDVPILILANKQDFLEAKSVEEITNVFDLDKLSSEHEWCIQGCSTRTGDGIMEGFLKLAEMIRKNHKNS